MSIRAEMVTLEECILAGITLGLSARKVLVIVREQGWRIDNNEFFRLYREREAEWRARKTGSTTIAP